MSFSDCVGPSTISPFSVRRPFQLMRRFPQKVRPASTRRTRAKKGISSQSSIAPIAFKPAIPLKRLNDVKKNDDDQSPPTQPGNAQSEEARCTANKHGQ